MNNSYEMLDVQLHKMLSKLQELRTESRYDPKNYRNIVNLLGKTYSTYSGCGRGNMSTELLNLCRKTLVEEIDACNVIADAVLQKDRYNAYRNWLLSLNQLVQISDIVERDIEFRTRGLE